MASASLAAGRSVSASLGTWTRLSSSFRRSPTPSRGVRTCEIVGVGFKPTRLDHGTPNSLTHVAGSCHIDMMMPTAAAVGEAEGGVEEHVS